MNTLKHRLQAEHTVIGTLVTMASSNVADLLSRVGFDFLWIDAEHGPAGFVEMQSMLQAAGDRCPALIRVPSSDDVWIKKALDTGCDGVVVPQVNSAEQARQVVASCSYPPKGTRSVGITRAHGYGLSFSESLRSANDSVAIICQIEHIDAVERIDQIAAVDGVDALFVGPFDLSGSLGVPAQLGHPDVRDAIARVVEAGRRHGIALGFFAVDPHAAIEAIAQGFTMIGLGMDASYLGTAAANALAEVRAVRTSS